MVFLNKFKRVPYYSQVPKPQKVHLKKPQFLDSRHCKLRRRSFFGQI